MKILSIKLENFRGVKTLEARFNGNADIYGANGTGKTTVANAICWLLVDRPATEEKDFNPKTVGMEKAHHAAEMRIKLDSGEEMTLKKDFYEKYTKKKGAAIAELTGTVTEYFIDGVKSKQKDYNATIERILGLPLDKAKMLLVLSYFAETMKTDEKRKILFELADEFTDEDVFTANKELAGLQEFLKILGNSEKLYTIEQWKSIASEERRKLNKDLELIPTRIDEVTKTLPEEAPDEEDLRRKLTALEAEKESVLEEKRNANSEDANKAAVSAVKVEIAEKKVAYAEKMANVRQEKNDEIQRLSDELLQIQGNIRKIDAEKPEVEKNIAKMKNMRQKLIDEYAKLQKEVFDKNAEICPTCGQKLPEEKIAELRAEFNRKKSDRLTEINSEGQACSKDAIKAAEEKLQKLKADWQDLNHQHVVIYKAREAIEKDLKAIPAFEDTEEYTTLQTQMEALKASASENDKAEIYDKQLADIQTKIESVNADIARAAAAKESEQRIKQLQAELKAASSRLDYLDHGIHLCEEFTRVKARMVTESVNKHFAFTRFILFREQINGGLKEVCEPTGQNKAGEWVEYRSLNFAAKINSQLDIVNAFNKHYGVNLPVIIDQAESVSDPVKIDEQVIRLIVSPTDEHLRIEQI